MNLPCPRVLRCPTRVAVSHRFPPASRDAHDCQAKDSARRDSDVNLALTVGTGQYVGLVSEWQKEPSDALVLKVMLKQYNSPADHTVRRYCDEFSVVLLPR